MSTDTPAEASTTPLTPGEALAKLFLHNADHGRNAANDELVAALLERARALRALADPTPNHDHPPRLPDTTARE